MNGTVNLKFLAFLKIQKILSNFCFSPNRYFTENSRWVPLSPLFTVESTMNLIYQTVMRSCYKPGKILPNARWERKKETLVLLYSRVGGGGGGNRI